ncbi:MAG TPA: hypothetical protein ENJ95_03395 [Bacteroidetes bacterium]|nr:hypothetical protein [Bacteroidota bacterium]
MKKFNWGTGIFVFYTVFAISLFYMVYRSTQHDHSLVVDNYYEKDLDYQSRYDQIKNSRNLKEGLRIKLEKKEKIISLSFPENMDGVTGNILLYRPDNKKLDKNIPLQLNAENRMDIPTDNIASGKWKVEVEWEQGGVSYFDKKTLYLPSV